MAPATPRPGGAHARGRRARRPGRHRPRPHGIRGEVTRTWIAPRARSVMPSDLRRSFLTRRASFATGARRRSTPSRGPYRARAWTPAQATAFDAELAVQHPRELVGRQRHDRRRHALVADLRLEVAAHGAGDVVRVAPQVRHERPEASSPGTAARPAPAARIRIQAMSPGASWCRPRRMAPPPSRGCARRRGREARHGWTASRPPSPGAGCAGCRTRTRPSATGRRGGEVRRRVE